MKFLKLIVAAFLFSQTAYAGSSSELSSLLNSLHSMRADFTQTIFDNRGKAIQTSYGHMALQRPGKFRWEISKPIPQLIVANDKRLWVYDPDLEQVTIRALHQAAGESPAVLLSQENATIDQDYAVTQIQKGAPHWQWFALAPRGADSVLASIQMGFMDKQLHEMKLQDHLGHTTKIEFQHTAMNVSLPDTLFTFKKPPHVDVIDETKRH